MKTPPEAYLIFREELAKVKLEKEKLKAEYEAKSSKMNVELEILKEQIRAQQDMMQRTADYAIKLESELQALISQIGNDKIKLKDSLH